MTVNLISVVSIFITFTVIIASDGTNANSTCHYMCAKCSESEFDIDGNPYCLKCNEKQGYIGVAGTCINKEDFPSKKIIDSCQSYSANVAFCAVCMGKDQIKIASSCEGSGTVKLQTKWIVIICVINGILLVGLIIMIIVLERRRRKQLALKEQDRNDNENSKVDNLNQIVQDNNIKSGDLPLPPEQVLEEEHRHKEDEFHACDKCDCSKNGSNEKAEIRANCNCGALRLNHANSFDNNNNLNSVKGKKILSVDQQQCKECISKCEK